MSSTQTVLPAASTSGFLEPVQEVSHPLTLSGYAVTSIAFDAPPPAPTNLGPFQVDTNGYVLSIVPQEPASEVSGDKCWLLLIRDIAAALDNTVGRGRLKMSITARQDWVTAWFEGRLLDAYKIEAVHVGRLSKRHPGSPGNSETHFVVWAPKVAGEIPAGVDVPGDWTSPKLSRTDAEINSYLVAAKAANTEQLSWSQRRRWVTSHLQGHKLIVDRISCHAQWRADVGWSGYLSSASACEFAPHPDLSSLLSEHVPANRWSTGALDAYLSQHGLTPTVPNWSSRVAVVQEHITATAVAKAIEDARPKFTLDPDQPSLGGYHRKVQLLDQQGRSWIFKPSPGPDKRFRSEVEHEAHVLARVWGYPTAVSHLIEFDGYYGQVQRAHPVAFSLIDYSGADFARLTVAQLCAVAEEHLLDWVLDNDDCHGENILVCTDGVVVGIDKGRAWRYFGGWDGLSADHHADFNAPLIYTQLYEAISAHHLPIDTVTAMYRAVIARARRIQYAPEEVYRQSLKRALEHRPHYQPSSYQRPVPYAPTCAQELIEAALARKRQLVADMETLWSRIYSNAGWEIPETPALGDNPQGHRLHAGLHSSALHDAIKASKSYGTAAFVAGTHIEDAHVLLWREKPYDKGFVVRGQFKLRPPVLGQVRQWLSAREVFRDSASSTQLIESVLPMESQLYDAIIWGACTVSYHWQDKKYNVEKLNKLWAARDSLMTLRQDRQAQLDDGVKDMDGRLVAAVAMANLYLGYIDAIMTHKASGTKSKLGDFPRYTFVPVPQPLPEAKPSQIVVERRSATRAAADCDIAVRLDGELVLNGMALKGADQGQPGDMYLLTLPNGETIEVRPFNGNSLSLQGLVRFTIPDSDDYAAGLVRVVDQFAVMGVDLSAADPADLELFYWRHLRGIMADRRDSCVGNFRYHNFWNKVPEAAESDLSVWRTAFAQLTSSDQIATFLAAGGHLPRFMHMDLRQPSLPTGHPYWERFDVLPEQWKAKQMPALHYRSGPWLALLAGAAMSTEERMRALAIWKPGMSSYEDMQRGSGAFVFTRVNQEQTDELALNLYFNPRVLIRTSNYGFFGDCYGRISDRGNSSYFDFDTLCSSTSHYNELLIKNALSLLDDIELMVFPWGRQRQQAVEWLAGLGISEIRGVPVTERCLFRGEGTKVGPALAVARAAYLSR